MARETKVGMLIGLGVILLIGIIVSDHLSVTRPEAAEAMTDFAGQAQRGIDPAGTAPPTATSTADRGGVSQPRHADQPAPTPTRRDPGPRFDEPDRLTIPDTASPLDRLPQSESADAGPTLAELPAPPQAWRTDTWSPRPGQAATTESDAGLVLPARLTGVADVIDRESAEAPTPPALAAEPDPALPLAAMPQRQPGAELIHVAGSGDTLTALASRYYGDSDYWTSIAAANRGAFDAEGNVAVGTRLIIPNRAGHIDPAHSELLATGLFDPAPRVNVPGASTADPAAPPKRPATERFVEVEPGDSLSKLAARHLGSDKLYLRLYEANKDRLDSPDHVVVGMKLRLPEESGSSPVPTEATPRPAEAPAIAHAAPKNPPATYTVQTGDNLSRIAEKALGDRNRWKEIYEANKDRLDSPDTVKVGQELRIPS